MLLPDRSKPSMTVLTESWYPSTTRFAWLGIERLAANPNLRHELGRNAIKIVAKYGVSEALQAWDLPIEQNPDDHPIGEYSPLQPRALNPIEASEFGVLVQ